MAALDTGQATVNTSPVLLFTIATAQEGFVSFTTNTAGGVYIGNKPNVSTTTGHFVPANVPVQVNLKANQGTTCYAVASGAATITWMFGA